MKTIDLFRDRTVFSFEVFPPRKSAPLDSVFATLDELQGLTPDYISVTYSASGKANKESTLAIAAKIKNDFAVESVAHLTCLHQTKTEILALLDQFRANNIENILALLGDPIEGVEPVHDFEHASDLAAFIKSHGDFNVLGACYPEGHLQAKTLADDIQNLKIKVDSGVSHLITQLFFENGPFYAFRDRAAAAGIHVPIQAGIMPVMSRRQAERVVAMSGVQLPRKFLVMLDRFADHPEALLDAGIAFAVEQIVDLLAHGVDGIHLYTMNNARVAHRINEAVRSLVATGSWCQTP